MVIDESYLDKRPFLRCEGIGEVSDLRLGRLDVEGAEFLIVAGWTGFALVDPRTAEVLRTRSFERVWTDVGLYVGQRCRIVDVDGDGALEFARLAAHWTGRTSVHDAEGRLVWVHPKDRERAPDFTAFGDLDGDGDLEFLMGFNAETDVDLLDSDGSLLSLWTPDWGTQVRDVQFVAVDGARAREIVHSGHGWLWRRSPHGEVVERVRPPNGAGVNGVSLVSGLGDPFSGDPPRPRLLVASQVGQWPNERQDYHVFDPWDGRTWTPTTEEAMAPYEGTLRVRFSEDGPDHLVRVDEILQQNRVAGFDATWLRVRFFDGRGVRVHQNVLEPTEGKTTRSRGCVAFLPDAAGTAGSVLVGYGTTIWEYTPGPRAP